MDSQRCKNILAYKGIWNTAVLSYQISFLFPWPASPIIRFSLFYIYPTKIHIAYYSTHTPYLNTVTVSAESFLYHVSLSDELLTKRIYIPAKNHLYQKFIHAPLLYKYHLYIHTNKFFWRRFPNRLEFPLSLIYAQND